MEENLKQLLLKDLCARLSYGVQVLADIDKTFDGGIIGKVVGVNESLVYLEGVLTPFSLDEIKPYLRPMSSMTEEEKKEYKHLVAFSGNPIGSASFIDFLNAHHFDYRGLLEKGLAIEAQKGE